MEAKPGVWPELEALIAEATASSMAEAMRIVERRLSIVSSFECDSKPTVYSGFWALCIWEYANVFIRHFGHKRYEFSYIPLRVRTSDEG